MSRYEFHGYSQVSQKETEQTQTSLTHVYEVLVQAGLRARARKQLAASQQDQSTIVNGLDALRNTG